MAQTWNVLSSFRSPLLIPESRGRSLTVREEGGTQVTAALCSVSPVSRRNVESGENKSQDRCLSSIRQESRSSGGGGSRGAGDDWCLISITMVSLWHFPLNELLKIQSTFWP